MLTKNSLSFLRDEINNLDKKIVKLLAKRKNLVLKIAQSKIKNNQTIRDLVREKNMLNELSIVGKKYHLNPKYIQRLFKLIIEESVLTQKQFFHDYPLNHSRFSCLGPQGSYSYIATCKYANHILQKYNIKEYLTFKEVIESVENYESDYAILPIENTSSGSIDEIFVFLKNTNLFIVGEINILINHCLLGIDNIALDQIENVYSHAQPFKQCSNFLKKFPKWQIRHTKSTSDAMKKVSEYNKKENVVLGSKIGGKIYGLKVLYQNLANQEQNITRFIILHPKPMKISDNITNKTTLLITISKESTSFENLLSILEQKKIVINKLICLILDKNLYEKIFYIDLSINLTSQMIKDIIENMQKYTQNIKILGCYPSEDTIFTIS